MKAVVAMSGGVDSSLSAALMVREGWETVGVTLKLLERAETGFGCCGSPADVDDAKRVCESLGIPHYTLNLAELFADKVIRPFIDAYLSARTPNPCVECNRSLKFGHLLALAEAWGADCVATGHYARTRDGRLFSARDEQKDQTYFLHHMTPRELAKARFPIGELTKPEVRSLARELGLRTADKPESQEICFVPRRDYRAFLKDKAGERALTPGPIVNGKGAEVGRHEGLASYTVGQRKGLRVPGPKPSYVVELRPESNTLVVGDAADASAKRLRVGRVNWIRPAPEDGRFSVRIRHRHAPAPARLLGGGDPLELEFDQAQRGAAPGQSAVFYLDGEVLGGGTIL